MISGNIFRPCRQPSVRSPTAQQTAAPAVMGAGGAGRSVLVSHTSPVGCCSLAGTAVLSAGGLELQDFWLPLGALQEASCADRAALNNSSHPFLLTGRNRKEQSYLQGGKKKTLVLVFYNLTPFGELPPSRSQQTPRHRADPKFQHLRLLLFSFL